MSDKDKDWDTWARAQVGAHWENIKAARLPNVHLYGAKNLKSFVITPSGKVKELSANATPSDAQALQKDVDSYFEMARLTGLDHRIANALDKKGMGRHPATIVTGDFPEKGGIGGFYGSKFNTIVIPSNDPLNLRATTLSHEWSHMLVAQENKTAKNSAAYSLANEGLAYAFQFAGAWAKKEQGDPSYWNNFIENYPAYDMKKVEAIFLDAKHAYRGKTDLATGQPVILENEFANTGAVPPDFIAMLRNKFTQSPTTGHLEGAFLLHEGKKPKVFGTFPVTSGISNDGLAAEYANSTYARTLLNKSHAITSNPLYYAQIAEFNKNIFSAKDAFQGGKALENDEAFSQFIKHYTVAENQSSAFTNDRLQNWQKLKTDVDAKTADAKNKVTNLDLESLALMQPAERAQLLSTASNIQFFDYNNNLPIDQKMNDATRRLGMWNMHDHLATQGDDQKSKGKTFVASSLVESLLSERKDLTLFAKAGEKADDVAMRIGLVKALGDVQKIKIGKDQYIEKDEAFRQLGIESKVTGKPATANGSPPSTQPITKAQPALPAQ